MSGHNKWSTIKHRKGAQDAKRSKIFSKYSKLISIAARSNPDPSSNPSLKSVIDQSRKFNMPNDKIDKAIKSGSDKDAAALKEISIQVIGPGSVALIAEGITDNSNRTIGEVKNIVTKNNGKMAEAGSLDWMFTSQGIIVMPIPEGDQDEVEMSLIDAGAEDIDKQESQWIVITSPNELPSVQEKLETAGIAFNQAEVQRIATNPADATDDEKQKVQKLIEAIESNEDINDVYSNLS